MKQQNNKAITPRDKDFAQWYTDVVRAAKLADYSPVRGCMILEPNGYAIWEQIQRITDWIFKQNDVQNVYMPLLIPESLLSSEQDLIEGFAPEVAWVTEGGDEKLTERLAIRPTSETLFGHYFSKKVQSYRDLPILNNQWCNVLRWEKSSRPFLRNREFLWQEGHTVHATQEDAEKTAEKMLDIYTNILELHLAIPVITGRKTDSEKFAGAEYTLTAEALMYNGYTLQAGTSHYLGQNFAKAYDIKFLDKDNKQKFAHTTSWGISTRLIGGLIMVHGDDRGLVLPPRIAPVQVRVVPLTQEAYDFMLNRYHDWKPTDVRVQIESGDSDKSAGQRFAETEVEGIPLRIEVGARDVARRVATFARRDTGEKWEVPIAEVAKEIERTLAEIQENLYDRAYKRMESLTFSATTADEMLAQIKKQPGLVNADWCSDPACEEYLKEKGAIRSRCITGEGTGKCVVCGKTAKHSVVWGLQY